MRGDAPRCAPDALRINAGIDVREGQHAVVGKTGIEGADKALILVLTAKVVE